jgi:hypothetical protein
MARIRYKPSAQRRGFKPQQLSTAGISRMREESNRLLAGMRERHRAEDAQFERDRRAMAEDQAYTERITKENNAIELRNLQIEAEREIGGITARMKQAEIDSKAVQDALSSITEFSNTAAKIAAQKQVADLKKQKAGLLADPYSSLDTLQAERQNALGTVALDASNFEDQVLSNEDPRVSARTQVSNPGRVGRVERLQTDRNFQTWGPIQVANELRGTEKTYQHSNGTMFSGVEAINNPEYASIIIRNVLNQYKELAGGAQNIPDTIKVFEQLEKNVVNAAIEERFKQDKDIAVSQVNVLFGAGKNTDDVAMAWSGHASILGPAKMLDLMQSQLENPDLPTETRQALLNFVTPVAGNKKPFAEKHANRVAAADAKARETETKRLNDQKKAREAEAYNWTLSSDDFIDQTIDGIQDENDLVRHEVELRRVFDDLFPGVAFPATLTAKFATAKKGIVQDFKDQIDDLYNRKDLDLPFVNAIPNATQRKRAKELYEEQQKEKFGDGYPSLLADITDAVEEITEFESQYKGDASGTTIALETAVHKWAEKNLIHYGDARALSAAIPKLLANAEIIDPNSNGDTNNPFRYRTVNGVKVFLEAGIQDPEKVEKVSWLSKKSVNKSLGELIQGTPYIISEKEQLDVLRQRESGEAIVFPYQVYQLKGLYKKADGSEFKLTEIYNALAGANNSVGGKNHSLLTSDPFTDLQDNASTAWNKLISSGNYDQVRRAGAMATGDLGYTRQQKRTANEFINMAATSGAKFPELVAAQMILESAGGTALSGTNNFFGMKATASESSTAKQTTEFRNGVERAEVANFKNYGSPQESVDDLVNKWYKDYPGYQGVNNANSLEEAAMMLQQQGYATDPEYAQKLIQIANRLR